MPAQPSRAAYRDVGWYWRWLVLVFSMNETESFDEQFKCRNGCLEDPLSMNRSPITKMLMILFLAAKALF